MDIFYGKKFFSISFRFVLGFTSVLLEQFHISKQARRFGKLNTSCFVARCFDEFFHHLFLQPRPQGIFGFQAVMLEAENTLWTNRSHYNFSCQSWDWLRKQWTKTNNQSTVRGLLIRQTARWNLLYAKTPKKLWMPLAFCKISIKFVI